MTSSLGFDYEEMKPNDNKVPLPENSSIDTQKLRSDINYPPRAISTIEMVRPCLK